jgi:hypothetical protein
MAVLNILLAIAVLVGIVALVSVGIRLDHLHRGRLNASGRRRRRRQTQLDEQTAAVESSRRTMGDRAA